MDSIDELVVLRRPNCPVRPGGARGNDAAELRAEENLKTGRSTSSSIERLMDDDESLSAGHAPRWAEQTPSSRRPRA